MVVGDGYAANEELWIFLQKSWLLLLLVVIMSPVADAG